MLNNELQITLNALRHCSQIDSGCGECNYESICKVDCNAIEKDAIGLIERLSKENEELKNLAERRLKRKNMYKERSERHLKEVLELRIKIEALENELLSCKKEC